MVKRTKRHGGKPNSFAEFRTIYQRRIVTRTRCAYSRLVFATFRHLSPFFQPVFLQDTCT